jgi:tetratricopeptide (TPR) repeat protein
MRKISLRWEPNAESFVGSYKVFRSESKTSGFAEKAATAVNSFEDAEIDPGKAYYYCVAAVSAEGRQSAWSCSGMVSGLKYAAEAPKGFVASPRDDSVELSWNPVQDPQLSHYLVYRKDKDEFKEIARVSTNSYVDRPVLPDKNYEYLVTSVSTDLLESEKTATLAVRSAPDREAPIEIVLVEARDFFAGAYRTYEKDGAGKIKLVNNTDETFSSLTLRFMTKDLMDSPSVTEIKELPAGGEMEFVLRPLLSPRAILLGQDMPVQAEVKVAYFRNDETKEHGMTFVVQAYEMHRVKWDVPERFAAVVTPGDPAIQDFATKVLSQYGGESDPLVRAAALFDALGVIGLSFRENPAAPYRAASEKPGEADSVQYPQETLSRKSGDVDDIAALYAALLEASGIRTAVLFLPGQAVPMFATTLKSGGASAAAAMTVEHDGLLWVPLDVRLVGGTFTKAWESGSRAYRDMKGGGLKAVDVRYAWESYRPYDLPDPGWRADLVRREEIEAKYGADFSQMKKARIENITASHIERLKADPADVDAALQLSFKYAEFGLLEEAAGVIEAALAKRPKDPALINNLGNVLFLRGSHEEAKKAYESAAGLDPGDAFILVNLARCSLKLGDRAEASRLFRQAAKMNKDVFRAYKKLAAYLM